MLDHDYAIITDKVHINNEYFSYTNELDLNSTPNYIEVS